MKIAQICPYPAEIEDQIPILPGSATQGGGETSSLRFAQKLAEKGHNVTYFTGKYPGINKNELIITPNFKIIYIKPIFKHIALAGSPKLFFKLLYGDYDVIQCHQIPIIYSLIGGFAAKLSGKKFVMTYHGHLPFCWVDSMVGRISSYFSDSITVQNKFAFSLVKNFVDEKKIVIIPHGVDTNLFSRRKLKSKFIKKFKSRNEKIILYVGRLIPAKGIDVLIKSLQILNKKINVKLIIIGEGPSKKYLMQLVKELSLQKNVIFLGSIRQKDLSDYYSLSDVFVLPSTEYDQDGRFIPKVSENFGLVLAESMSCGTPVIASNLGGIPYWIKNNYNGLLFEERNVKELSDLILKLFKNNKLKEKIIRNALNDIKNKYSWDPIINRFEEIYQ